METDKLPERTPCEVWVRCMGYYRPISHFNLGKKSEHYSRVHFDEKITMANKKFIEEYKK